MSRRGPKEFCRVARGFFRPILLFMAIVNLACSRNESERKTRPDQTGYFGGGYKTAKWGMSKEEVKLAIANDISRERGKVAYENPNYIEVHFSGKKQTKYHFFNDRLNMVVYNPGLQDGDKEGVEAILNLLREKYGGREIKGERVVDGIPYEIRQWKTGDTRVTFSMFALEWSRSPYLNPPASTLNIIYNSISLKKEEEAAEEQKKEAIQRQRIFEKQEEYNKDL